ncbi:MAG TPA: adenylosuccinate synthase [Candidatus Thermoplasmatota archaeon]|jgi:adenylosuccinate synthase|nr:adenylosuccinate synthase [Candidatus Thermoplasmatota archaeon]
MPATVIVGAQWGDEGKGKVTDVLARSADVVARYQGGNNAGHTIVVQGEEFKLHHLPAAVLHPQKLAVIGNGVVIDPGVLLDELDKLAARGRPVQNLRISERAHVILPWHRALDAAREATQEGVGSTKRGIGPAYADKAAREGLRVADLVDRARLERHVRAHLPARRGLLAALGSQEKLDGDAIVRDHAAFGERLRPYVTDTATLLQEQHEHGKRILLEGAQGTLLDVDHGTYPFVTSSSTTSGGACTGTGLPPTAIEDVVGVAKAYTTRVGLGPFPTEDHGAAGEHLATVGREVGTTTGRRRRTGWLDLVLLRYAARVNGLTSLAITKLDVLGGLATIKVATHYTLDGRDVHAPPARVEELERARVQWREFRGWSPFTAHDVQRIARGGIAELPSQAQEYLDFLRKALHVPIGMVGIGPGREDTIEVSA